MFWKLGLSALVATVALAFVPGGVSAETIEWETFTIRNSNTGSVAPAITEKASGAGVDTHIALAGQKTGYGTSAFDGMTLGSILSFNFDRLDAGLKHPYVNIWVHDGNGNSAVITPSVVQNGGGITTTNVKGMDFQSLGIALYETDFGNLSWLGITGAHRPANGIPTQALLHADNTPVLISQLSHLIIGDIGNYSSFVGTGAPRNGTGFNFIFGDTQNSFVQTNVPYSIDNVSVQAVPLPAAAWGGFALFGMIAAKRRFRLKARS